MEGLVIALFLCLFLALVTKYLSVPAIPFYILARSPSREGRARACPGR